MKASAVLAVLTATAFALTPFLARADGAWLDAPLAQWNSPGMAVPAAPLVDASDATDPRCARQQRPAETAADEAVAAAGWQLYQTYEAGWGVTLVHGLSGHDGMCRPFGYQDFVFVDGVFAGTISPTPMNSRSDGADFLVRLHGDQISASFNRYADSDPLCCPSRGTDMQYRIDRGDAGPVLVATQAMTTANGR